MFDTVDENVNLGFGRVEVERGPCRRLDAESLVYWLRAVMTRTHRDPLRIQQLAHIVRVDAVDLEADRAAPVDGLLRSDDREAVHLLHSPERVGRDGLLVGRDGLHANAGEVVDRGTQTNSLRDRRRTRFEP